MSGRYRMGTPVCSLKIEEDAEFFDVHRQPTKRQQFEVVFHGGRVMLPAMTLNDPASMRALAGFLTSCANRVLESWEREDLGDAVRRAMKRGAETL